MSKKEDAKLVMLVHSKAKVDLYASYLSRYLNILGLVEFIQKIYLYDLMCGEGIYSDGSEGSPIVAMKKIKEYYFQNKKTCPNIEVWFNDKEISKIEKDRMIIDRVKEYCTNIKKPYNVNLVFSKEDYVTIYPRLVSKIKSLKKNERMLIFLDPYGYKEIKPSHLQEILVGGKTELILFLPISFMSRVANKSISAEDFPGGRALEEFLKELIGIKDYPKFSTKPKVFIEELKKLFKEYLINFKIFVDTFSIERDMQNVYCLFFFTPHIRGFEKMLDAKWGMDEERGKGFRINFDQGSFFDEIEVSNYEILLETFIKDNDRVKTNADVYRFGLENGFLPKHSCEVMKKWQKSRKNFKVYFEDGSESRNFYIPYNNHTPKPKKVVKYLFE